MGTSTTEKEIGKISLKEPKKLSIITKEGTIEIKQLKIEGKKSFVNTLNGSGLAVGRTLAALVENNIKDDTIAIPKVLHDLTGFKTIKL